MVFLEPYTTLLEKAKKDLLSCSKRELLAVCDLCERRTEIAQPPISKLGYLLETLQIQERKCDYEKAIERCLTVRNQTFEGMASLSVTSAEYNSLAKLLLEHN